MKYNHNKNIFKNERIAIRIIASRNKREEHRKLQNEIDEIEKRLKKIGITFI